MNKDYMYTTCTKSDFNRVFGRNLNDIYNDKNATKFLFQYLDLNNVGVIIDELGIEVFKVKKNLYKVVLLSCSFDGE